MAFPTGWNRKCKITIDHTLVAGTLTDFPFLLTLANLPSELFDSDGTYPAQNGGGDIRFSSDSAGTTQLACEVVSLVTNTNPASGSAEVWVKVPSVSTSVDTDIYVWYNTAGTDSQPSVSDTYGRNAVWSSFVAVYHAYNESSGATCVDSTGNGHVGTVDADDGPQTGPRGNANSSWGLDGAFDDVPTGGASLLNGLSAFTVESWVYSGRASVNDADTIWSELSGVGTAGAVLRYDATGFFGGQSNVFQLTVPTTGGADSVFETAANSAQVTTWQYVTAKWASGSAPSVLINGVVSGPSNSPAPASGTVNDGVDFTWGLRNANQSLDGRIGEGRISSSSRSSAWLAASYSNQSAPGTFAAAGTAEDAAGGGGVTATPTTAALTLTAYAPTVAATDAKTVTPTTAGLTLTAYAPNVITADAKTVTPSTASLTLTTYAPAVSTPVIVTPATASLSLTSYAPTIVAPVTVTPTTAALTLASFAPTVTATAHVTATPSTASLTITAYAPDVLASGAVTATPTTAALTLTSYAPDVTASGALTVTPTTAALVLTSYAPDVTAGASLTVTPSTIALVLTGNAPTVTGGAGVTVTPATSTLVLTTFTAEIATPVTVTPTTAALAITTYAPSLGGDNPASYLYYLLLS